MSNLKICNRCVLNENYPGVKISDSQKCSCCTDMFGDTYKNYRAAFKNYQEFKKGIKNFTGKHYALLMLSGGKDSTYLLNELVNKYGINVLGFSVKHPFESEVALNNINSLIQKIPFEHIHLSLNTKVYKKIMQKVFSLKRDDIFSERLPCTVCGYITEIAGVTMAYMHKIPYVVYANDPLQILNTDYNIKKDLENMIKICGKADVYSLFGKDIIDEIIRAEEDELPTIVTPYVAMMDSYNENEIIEKLKAENLYRGDSVQTYCSLVPLLNYYSFSKYNSYFFGHQLAQEVRQGNTDRDFALSYMEMYRKIIMEIAIKEDITEDDMKFIRTVLEKKIW